MYPSTASPKNDILFGWISSSENVDTTTNYNYNNNISPFSDLSSVQLLPIGVSMDYHIFGNEICEV
jgi:hypothetical protein